MEAVMKVKFFRNLEIVGAFFVFSLAFLLHCIYQLTDGTVFSILFGAVNESVWENTKIFLITYAIWGLVELLVSNVYFKPFVVGKVLGIYFMGFFIIIMHYLFSLFVGDKMVGVDIAMGIFAVIFSQIISYKVTLSDKNFSIYFVPSLFLLGLFLIAYFSFTVFPPHMGLFKDETTGFYGILPNYVDKGAAVLNNL